MLSKKLLVAAVVAAGTLGGTQPGRNALCRAKWSVMRAFSGQKGCGSGGCKNASGQWQKQAPGQWQKPDPAGGGLAQATRPATDDRSDIPDLQ